MTFTSMALLAEYVYAGIAVASEYPQYFPFLLGHILC